MQVCVGGTAANAAFSTVVWQYRQSIPSSPGVQRVAVRHRLLGLVAHVDGSRRGAIGKQENEVGGHHDQRDRQRRSRKVGPSRKKEATAARRSYET